MSTPTKKSMDLLRAQGYQVAVVEKWVPAGPNGYKGNIITRDVWNFGDILACRPPDTGSILVQTTGGTGGNFTARLHKIQAIDEARKWLQCGNEIQIHGWRKIGPLKRFKVRIMDVVIERGELVGIERPETA